VTEPRTVEDSAYKILFEHGTMPMWVLDEESQAFLAVNDAVVAKYGWSKAEFLAMRLGDLCHEDKDVVRARSVYREYVPGNRPGVLVEGPLVHRTKDGHLLDVRVETTRVTFANRRAVLSTVIDESRRRHLERRLSETDGLWQALVESSPDLVMLVDPTGTVLFVNRARTPFSDRVVVGEKIWAFALPDGEARLQALLRRLVESQQAIRYEAPGLGDGGAAWYEVCTIPLVIDGEVKRILWTATDVTARRTALEKVSFQAAVLSQVSQPVVATDGAGNVTYWSPAAERLYGWTQQEVLGNESTALLRTRWPDAPGREGFLASLQASDAWAGCLGHVTKTGEQIVVEASVQVLRDAEGTVSSSIAVMQDVTARRSLEEQLRQSQKMEAVGLLAGGVAHDFNNLLAVIMGFAELSTRKLPPGHPVAAQLEEVLGAARHGGDLTRKLLAFSRKQVIQPTALDVGDAVVNFVQLIRRVVGEDVEVSVERGPVPIVVRADPVQLEQVLLNLCTNARQAMPDGGRLLLLTRSANLDATFVAKHPWAREGCFAEIVVRDTGVGMDAATSARIFEPFFTTKRDGTGLGLSTVYGIVQQHGGFLHVDSTLGVGTTFRVLLPLAEGVAAPAAPARLDGAGKGARGRERILVAEDEPALRRLVTTALTDLGYSVITTADGEEAVREYGRWSSEIALVVLDVVLPRLEARQVYERMRAIRPDVKVLFTTGYAPESARLRDLLEGGRIPLLEKPFTPSMLAARVRAAIDG
jgi:two-component system cell cycle sensor histidine kinase/response regulator CckA